jgi:hypothetical protein
MHTTWQMMGCTDNKNNCDEKTILTESMKCNLMLSHKNHKPYDTTMALANSGTYLSSNRYQNTQCMLFCLFVLIGFSFVHCKKSNIFLF